MMKSVFVLAIFICLGVSTAAQPSPSYPTGDFSPKDPSWSAQMPAVCQRAGVPFSPDGTVTGFHDSLKGTSNGTNFPSGMTSVDLSFNLLQGSPILSGLPASLQKLDLTANQFSGGRTLNGLPTGLQKVDLWGDQFRGSPDLSGLPAGIPAGLEDLYLNSNRFLRGLPAGIQLLELSENQVSGTPIMDRDPFLTESPPKYQKCQSCHAPPTESNTMYSLLTGTRTSFLPELTAGVCSLFVVFYCFFGLMLDYVRITPLVMVAPVFLFLYLRGISVEMCLLASFFPLCLSPGGQPLLLPVPKVFQFQFFWATRDTFGRPTVRPTRRPIESPSVSLYEVIMALLLLCNLFHIYYNTGRAFLGGFNIFLIFLGGVFQFISG